MYRTGVAPDGIGRILVKLTLLLAVALWLSWVTQAHADSDLVVSDLSGQTPEDLVAALLGGGDVTVSNVQYHGVEAAAGTFTGGNGIIGFDSGIVLSTGSAADVAGPNLSDFMSGSNGAPGDDDLDALVAEQEVQTFDAAVLEFDFVPSHDIITFEYVFASEEYNEFVNSPFNDVFAFFLNGDNVALIPGNATPVAINNVNGGNPFGINASHPDLYINNDLDDGGGTVNTELDGLTVVLMVEAEVIADETNHIKLAIGDAGDDLLDSAVFIKAGSFVDTRPPVAVDDAASTPAGTPVDVDVLDNDSDPENADLEVIAVTQASNGTVQVNPDGTVTYQPASGFQGTDTFTYTVSDGQGGTDIALVTVEVTPASAPEPVLVNDLLSLQNLTTSYNPADNRAPAGVYTITATWKNISSVDITDMHTVVMVLSGGHVVLNADGGSGGVGSILSVPPEALGDGILQPGETFSLAYEIGLVRRERFDFFVDVYGIPES